MISPETLAAALRVLDAIDAHEKPNPMDISAVEIVVGPKHRGMGIEEIVCETIECAIRERRSISV